MRTEGKSIYFLSGIGTRQAGNLMFGAAMEDIVRRYRGVGVETVHVRDLYPYGVTDGISTRDIRKYITRQAMEVSRDMYTRYHKNVGGFRAFQEIQADYDAEGAGSIVLIGHSGGGVAAYKTAKLLTDKGYSVEMVILVGTPVQGITDAWQGKVRCLRKAGRLGDPVTWWGRPCIGAPRHCEEVDIVQGHPYYFRSDVKDSNGVSNLTKVMDKIWSWLWPVYQSEEL